MTTVDYLRIATWDFETYTSLVAQIRRKFGAKWTRRHWLQYRGFQSNEGLFYGSGDQGDRKHFVFSTSGAFAHEMFKFLMSLGLNHEEIYCTRIDLQQTIAHPRNVHLRRVYKVNPRKAKKYIESDTDTVYIGARTSNIFTRLYQKLEKTYLRLEHEFKGERAKNIWYHCLVNPDHQRILHGHFVNATHKCKFGAWASDAFNLDFESPLEAISVPREEMDLVIARKLQYLMNTEQALEKYISDHDMRVYASAMIERLYRYSERISLETMQEVDKISVFR